MLRQQATQHSQLINVIKDNTETSSQAVLTAVQEAFLPVQPTTGPATPITQGIFNPAEDPSVELEDCSQEMKNVIFRESKSQMAAPLEVSGTSHNAT